MGLRDMKYIGLKHHRENKQNSDNNNYQSEFEICNKLKYKCFIYNFKYDKQI